MSHSFYVTTRRPQWQDVVPALELPELRWVEELPESGAWPDGHQHAHLEGISTRGVEVCWRRGRFQTRVMTCSAPEEYALAMRLAQQVAALEGAEVEPEDGPPMSPSRLCARYDDEWVEQIVASGFRALAHVASQEGEVSMSGPRRPFHLGRRRLAELAEGTTERTFGHRVLAAMRRLQWVDTEEDCYAAGILGVRNQLSGTQFKMAVWGPGVRYLFPQVDYLAVLTDEQLLVPWTRLAELAPRIEWLDEKHALVEEVPDDEWDGFLARARAIAVRP